MATNKHTFEIELSGANVSPENIPAGDLADLVRDLEAAIIAAMTSDDIPTVGDSEDVAISLIGISAGSEKLTFAASNRALPAVGIISESIYTKRYDIVPELSQERMHKLYLQASRKRWKVSVLPDDKHGIHAAVISHEFPIPAPMAARAVGTTTILGELVRVGGATTPRAEIRLQDSTLIHIDMTREIAKQVSGRLYDHISIEGDAIWRVSDWKMLEFRARRITGYRPGEVSLTRTFEDLAEASEGRWDNIDAEKYINAMRDGEEP